MAVERRIGTAERTARLVRRQLGRRAGSAAEVAQALGALHATDPATVFLSVGARLAEPERMVEAVEQALYGDSGGPAGDTATAAGDTGTARGPGLVRMLAMRRTMFVVTADAAPDVYAAAGQHIAAKERKSLLGYLAEGGWDEAWLAQTEDEVVAALAEHGELSGAQLSRLIPRLREQVVVARGKPYEATQNIASRVIRTMATENRIERRRPAGSWTSSQFRWAAARPLAERTVEAGRAAVVRSWLAAFGPGTAADLKWWSGWTLTEVRKALAAVGAETVRIGEQTGYVLPGDVEAGSAAGAGAETPPEATLLPALDPTPMGWQDRDWFLPVEHRAALFDRTGNIGPTVWWGGEVVGGWAQRPDGTVVWRALADRGAQAADAVEREAAELTARLGDVRITPRFRTPLERELAG